MKIIFVTGKGGVGKSAIAAAMALKMAKTGSKTLLVELGNSSFYKEYFAMEKVSYSPSPLKVFDRVSLDVALWSGHECLREYAQHLLKIESLYKLFFENTVSKSFIGVAPALMELSLLGKVTSQHRKVGPPINYDYLVIDCYATGHFLALLKAPQGMAEAVRLGPMGEQSRSILKVIKDPNVCEYHIVAIAEELPVTEALELSAEIQAQIGCRPNILLNKLINPSPAALSESPTELKDFQNYLRQVSQREITFAQTISKIQDPLKLPMIFSTDPETIIPKLADCL